VKIIFVFSKKIIFSQFIYVFFLKILESASTNEGEGATPPPPDFPFPALLYHPSLLHHPSLHTCEEVTYLEFNLATKGGAGAKPPLIYTYINKTSFLRGKQLFFIF
jgi:hypothetical protein